MKIYRGKQVEGPVSWIPHIFVWGGCLFVNVWRVGYMIPLHREILDLIEFLGFDPYDG